MCSCDQKNPVSCETQPKSFFNKVMCHCESFLWVAPPCVRPQERFHFHWIHLSSLCCHHIITYGLVLLSMPVVVRVYIEYACGFFFSRSYLPWFLMVCIRSLAPLIPEYVLSFCAMEQNTQAHKGHQRDIIFSLLPDQPISR